ncbi:MAG: hypothetical protein AUJ98_07520 [Bacteroidetes bacterium CG2_30_33_31]|nr:MAG: hypothetical protein AUJ98_07520 [Bacteroidetes bacterium CG2_30_33_31]
MMEEKRPFFNIQGSISMLPQEERLAVGYERKSMVIGIPKEKILQERRVALVPSAVNHLVLEGNRVLIERGAGLAANFSDIQYSEVGAEIVDSSAAVFKADIIAKIVPPTLEEVEFMKDRSTLISALHIQGQRQEVFRKLISKKITALSYEHIRDKSNTHPVLHSISEIVGSTAVLIGAKYLSDSKWGRGKMLGGFTGINPSNVVILGAGTVGEFAARAAMGFGATVKIFDNSLSKLSNIQHNLQARVFTSIIQEEILLDALISADVVIGTIFPKYGANNLVITEAMVEKMKKGSVIVDVSIDKGGCSETSHETNHDDPVYQIHHVTHYCVPNISSGTPHTSSYALSNYIGPFISELSNAGGLEKILMNDQGVRNGIYIYRGMVVMKEVSEYFGLPFHNLDLLLVSF